MDWITFGLIVAVLLLLLATLWIRPPEGFPPGPFPYPLVGSIPALVKVKAPSKQDIAWAVSKQFGPVTGLFLGPWPVVVINGYEAVQHVLKRDDLAYRPKIRPANSYFFQKRLGVFFTDGPEWRDQRRFTLRQLRDFGFARHSMEGFIHEEASSLIQAIETESATPNPEGHDILKFLPATAINVIWMLTAGQRYELSDPKFHQILKINDAFFRNSNPLSVVALYPLLQLIPFGEFRNQVNAIKGLQEFLKESIDEHISTFDDNHQRDFMDVFIKEMKNETDALFTQEQLITICTDIFTAGTAAISGSLAYCLRSLVQNIQVQDKLREEIYRVIGTHRLPSMEDVPKLHYSQAVVDETLRSSGIVPFTAPHATQTDTEVLGYRVPKDSLFLVNLWSMHMDPELWEDPENFRPERFIDCDGTYRKSLNLMPFGMGPRVCIGETVSRYLIVLFVTALVQRFEFHVPPLGSPPSNKQLPGVVTSPAPFRVSVNYPN